MTRSKGDKLRLKDISVSDQDTMGLEWAWKAGAEATYIKEYGHEYYHNERKPCSLVLVRHTGKPGRELWVFDMFLENKCIWRNV